MLPRRDPRRRSERGVCAILMGDDPAALARDLQDRFPQAQLIGGDAGFEALVAKVVGFVEAPALGLDLPPDLPLDMRGTAFQQLVWQALREIPAGSAASYAEIVKRRAASPSPVSGIATMRRPLAATSSPFRGPASAGPSAAASNMPSQTIGRSGPNTVLPILVVSSIPPLKRPWR
jgi:6-O-methylguanine DNA methyltransferase, DNA binding domain